MLYQIYIIRCVCVERHTDDRIKSSTPADNVSPSRAEWLGIDIARDITGCP